MLFRYLFLLMTLPLFSIATGAAATSLGATNSTVFFPIDSSERGNQIVATFGALPPNGGREFPEVELQTTLPQPTANSYTTYKYINYGIIPWVQSITQTPNNTLLIIAYYPNGPQFPLQYIVLPAEQVTAYLYFSAKVNQPNSPTPFISSPIPGTVPYYSVDPRQRAADIVSATNQLMATPFRTSATNQVWIQTTLTGPFNPPAATNGLLRNVQSISITNNSLIIITYLPPNQPNNVTQTIVVAPEQVQQIVYILNLNTI